jgi:tRNA-uridine 2-sulfurtransferase
VVYLAQGDKHPALYRDSLVATELSWVSPKGPPKLPFECKSKIRYRQPDQPCVITKIEEGKAWVEFKVPQRAVTQRQSIVFYDDEICLGGGFIETPGPTYYERGLNLPPEVST